MTPSVLKNPDVIKMRKPRQTFVRARMSYLTSEQLDRVLAAAKARGLREHALVLFLYSHGCRTQEACNLTISHLDFSNELVHIYRVKHSLDSVQSFLKVKGNPLRDERAALKAWLAVRPADSGDYVFNSRESKALNRTSIYRIFRDLATEAGLPENLRHPHCLKHTRAMSMLRAGVDAFTVRMALGHKSFNSTLSYCRPSDSDADAARIKADSQTWK